MERKERFEELFKNIHTWALSKDLIKPENAETQYLKVLEEVGETASALLKNDVPAIKDGFGDSCITIVILAYQKTNMTPKQLSEFYCNIHRNDDSLSDAMAFVSSVFIDEDDTESPSLFISSLRALLGYAFSKGYDLLECLELAYNEIKDRRGVTKNGNFIKQSPEEFEFTRREHEERSGDESYYTGG